MFAGTEKVPHSQEAHVGEFKTQSAELQTRNSTAKREWQLSETESRQRQKNMEDMRDWMVYLTNNYGLDYGHEYDTLYCVMQRSI